MRVGIRIEWVALAGALALAPACASVQSVSESVSTSVRSVSTAVQAASRSSSRSSGAGDTAALSEAWRRDVRTVVAAGLRAGEGPHAMLRDLGRVAAGHGISDWEGRADTGRAIQAGRLDAGGADGAAAPPSWDGHGPVELVHVAANVGGASGGHAALRFGDDVYHFEQDAERAPGVFRLLREDWAGFVLRYSDLENRTLRVARLALPPEEAAALERRFALRYQVQRKLLARRDALARDAALLDALSRGPAADAPLPRAGLLARGASDDPHAAALREVVARARGGDFLARERARAEAALAALPVTAALPDDAAPAQDRWPVAGATLSERFADAASRREALRALEEARGLAPGALLAGGPVGVGAAGMPLGADERAALVRWRDAEARAVLALLDSRRPDAGQALLLADARYQAASLSLERGILVVLDPYPDDAPSVPPGALVEHRAALAVLAERAGEALREARRAFAAARGDALEPSWARVESAAGLAVELRGASREGRPLRVAADPDAPFGLPAPSRSARVATGLVPPAPAALAAARSEARQTRRAVDRTLQSLYPYDLVRSNCASELARALDVDGLASFVPFVLFDRAVAELPVREVRVLPGRRLRELGGLYETSPGPRVGVWLRETRVASSTLYTPLDVDTSFLFFTDDAAWARPALGLANLGYALGDAAGGLATAPFDPQRGRARLSRGLRGALFSLPELVFANVRKGSYEAPPPAEASAQRAASSPSSMRSASLR